LVGQDILFWASMSGNDIEDFAWAVKTEDMTNVASYIKQLGVNVRDQNQRTPLHWAADYGQVSMIEFLSKQPKVEINAKDRFGITPLLAAVYENHEEAVKALLAHGADKTIKGPSGETPKEAAEKESIKKLLCKSLSLHDFLTLTISQEEPSFKP
jgi:ankyrin repeat protein